MDPLETVRAFYAAFARRDGAAMAALYADDARFSDPVFPALQGREIGRMWTMLCQRGKDLQVVLEEAAPEGDWVLARWRATYTFSQTGRPVVNVIQARLKVRDGRIVEHRDQFDFGRWARQALGPVGWLLGWSGVLRRKVQAQAAQSLARFAGQSA